MTARATSPPTHAVAPRRCTPSALTPVMWSRAEAEWPVSASGSSASHEPKKPHASTALESVPAHAMTTTRTTIALRRFIRRICRSQTTEKSCVQKPSRPTGTPARSAKVSTTRTRSVTIHATPATDAALLAKRRRPVFVVSGTRNAPTRRKPTVSAAATSWAAWTTGMPQRTRAPGSPAS